MKERLVSFWAWIRSDRKRTIAAVAVVILLVAGIWKLGFGSKNKTTYQTAKVAKGTIVSSISASGAVVSTGILSIKTEASGVVKKVYVKDGEKVFAGQQIAEITLDQSGLERNASSYASYIGSANGLNAANNAYRSAQASAEKVLDEVKGHDKDETLTQKETRTKAEVARDNAYDSLRSAQANLVSASLNYRASSPVITAPFSGIIESISLVEGMTVGVSSGSSSSSDTASEVRIAVIKNQTAPVVSVTLSEVDVPKVKVGQKATITLDSIPDKTFTGVVATVDRIGTTTSNVTSYPANIKLDSGSAEILPNMAVAANIILETKTDVLMVPLGAISTQNGESYAKILKDGKEVDVPVEVGISSDIEIEVVSDLTEGETVITGTSSTSASSSSSRTRSVFSGGFGGGGPR